MRASSPEGAEPVTNSAFLALLGEGAPAGTSLWVTAFTGSPDLTEVSNWFGQPYHPARSGVDTWRDRNAYFSVAALRPAADGQIRRRKVNFARLLALVADDVQVEDVPGPVSYVLATSPGKAQVGIFIDPEDEDAADQRLVDRLVTSMVERGMLRADKSGNNSVRYVRLPVGQNQKPREQGAWQHQMHQWTPGVRLSLDDAAAAFGIDLDELRGVPAPPGTQAVATGPQDERLRVLTANVIRGEGLHDALNQIAASLVASGTAGGAAVNLLRGIMDASLAPKDERWLARYNDIPRSVSTAQEKFKQPTTIALAALEEPAGLILDVKALRTRAQAARWSVKHVVPENALGMVFGASGAFKSFVVLDYVLHRCYGMPWLGQKTRQAVPVYIAAEGGAGLIRRIDAWHMKHGMDADACPLRIVIDQLTLTTQAGALRDAIQALGITPGDIVIDTMSQTFDGEENSAKEVSAFFRQIGADLRAAFGCTVIVVHHTGHGNDERARGSSAIGSNLDFQFSVARDADAFITTMTCVKQKDAEKIKPVNFVVEEQILGKDEDGEKISSLSASWVDQAGSILKHVEASRSSDQSLLIQSVRECGDMQAARKLFYEKLGDIQQGTKKKKWQRAKEMLMASGVLKEGIGGELSIVEASE